MQLAPSKGNSALLVLMALGIALYGSGCRKRTVQAAPPVVVSQPAPAPAPAPAPKQPEEKAEPTPVPVNPAPATPAATKSSSPRVTPTPKPAQPTPTPEPPPAPKAAAPQISPRLSPAQQVEYETKTEDAIRAAEGNLQRAYGRQLNTAQQDLMDKVRTFLAQSREAGRAKDWVRALNLAEKARVLSVELVNSL